MSKNKVGWPLAWTIYIIQSNRYSGVAATVHADYTLTTTTTMCTGGPENNYLPSFVTVCICVFEYVSM